MAMDINVFYFYLFPFSSMVETLLDVKFGAR